MDESMIFQTQTVAIGHALLSKHLFTAQCGAHAVSRDARCKSRSATL